MATEPSEDLTAFDPNPMRAAAVSALMQGRLADSLRYIAGHIDGRVPVEIPDLTAVLVRIGNGPVPPQLFGAYYDLVLALNAGAFDRAKLLLDEIAAAPNLSHLRIIDLPDPGPGAAANRYRRMADTDPEMPLAIQPPPAQDAALARALIGEAFALMQAGNSALFSEIRILLREIVLAAGSDAPQSASFDGASSFMMWGSVILNVHSYKTVLDMVQALAHESGHNLLFGLCANGPLHENDDDERYPSPLRTDKRPMDGIVHATYVAARMNQSVRRLDMAGALDARQKDEAHRANIDNEIYFASGMETIRAHARLTPLGKSVIGRAERYMAAFTRQAGD